MWSQARPKLKPGDLVRVDFCDRTAVVLTHPRPVIMNGDDLQYRVSIRWEDGTISNQYNTEYLEMIRAAG